MVTIILLTLLVLAALWTVMTSTLLVSAIGLAVTSAVLSMVMFQMNSPLAAVFELSVCAGLITVVFISAISLVKPESREQERVTAKARTKRYLALPILMAVVGGLMWVKGIQDASAPQIAASIADEDVRNVFWNVRRLDLVGQITILLAGVFGVVVLFKQWASDKETGDV